MVVELIIDGLRCLHKLEARNLIECLHEVDERTSFFRYLFSAIVAISKYFRRLVSHAFEEPKLIAKSR